MAARDASGKWLPGQSPNPAGKPKKVPAARAAIEAGLPTAIEYLLQVIVDAAHEPKDRIAAAKTILDFGMPKPRDAQAETTAAEALAALADKLTAA